MSNKPKNPGNFANRPKEEVSEIGRKGAQARAGRRGKQEQEQNSGTTARGAASKDDKDFIQPDDAGEDDQADYEPAEGDEVGDEEGDEVENEDEGEEGDEEIDEGEEGGGKTGSKDQQRGEELPSIKTDHHNLNPGNFQNRSREDVVAAAKKGGQHSYGGFATMDPEKQRAIASKGGKVAHERGHAHEFTSEEAKAAGQKGGHASHRGTGAAAEVEE